MLNLYAFLVKNKYVQCNLHNMPEEVVFDKKELKEALQKAKQLEKEPLISNEELVKLYQENMQRSEKVQCGPRHSP